MTAAALSLDLFADYDPHPHARAAFLDDARFLLMRAGRRGAKSHTGARRFLRRIYGIDLPNWIGKPYLPGAAKRGTALWWKRRPRLHYWVCASEYELLAEPMRYLLEFLPAELLEHADVQSNSLWLYPDILIEFKTLHDPKQKVGSGLNGLWIEEAARVSPEAWQGFIRPALADKQGWAQFTTTPLGQDWTWEQIEKPANDNVPGYACHSWFTEHNTRVPGLIAEVEEARRLLPPAYFNREYRASREAFIGQIYPFDEATMVHDELPPGIQLVRRLGGQDWGFTAPGAHVVGGLTSVDPNRAHVWIVDEEYSPSQLVEEWWIPAVRRKMSEWKYHEVVADPAEPDNIVRFKQSGIACVGHKNYQTAKFDEHERSVRAGIRTLASLMHQRRFHVLRRCKNLVSELKSYRWDAYKSGAMGGTLIERPAPGQKEHAATACRYLVTYGLKGASFVPLQSSQTAA